MSKTRRSQRRKALLGAFLLCGLAGCSKPKRTAHAKAAASSEAAAASGVPAMPADAAPDATKRAPVARDSLVTPPLTAPADSLAGPGGTQLQVLRLASGESPGPVDTLVLDYSLWKSDGALVASSYLEPQPAAFSVSSLPPELRSLLTQLKCGSKVRYWLPRAALAGWKPPEWPDDNLVFELEPLHVTHVVVRNSAGVAIEPLPYQPPDGAGAPSSAKKTASGLFYIFLGHATAMGPHPKASDRIEVIATLYVIDGLAVKLLARDLKTATTLERAPGRLNEVLSQLSSGDQVRVWLPKGLGQQVIPDAGTRDTIVDLAVSFTN